MRDHPDVDSSEIQAAFDDVLDQVIVFHGFADYMRDYEVFIYATADPRTGIRPEHVRYRFAHCVRASATSAVVPAIWKRSLDERLVDYDPGPRAIRRAGRRTGCQDPVRVERDAVVPWAARKPGRQSVRQLAPGAPAGDVGSNGSRWASGKDRG
jgi:hypothetical protein